jgi:RNA polymerase sigma-70 factor (ECF subfamily)
MCTDESLWLGMLQGDREMFLALYRKYYHSLLFIGLKKIKDPNLVKDAIQQQFLYLWEKRESLSPANNVRSYLINAFLRKLTADWIKTQQISKLELAWSGFDQEPPATPEEKLIAHQDRQQIHQYLQQQLNTLPTRQRELIMMRFYEGLTYDEMAEKTGLTHRTIYNKTHEALKRLKQELEKEKGVSARALSWLILAALAGIPVH